MRFPVENGFSIVAILKWHRLRANDDLGRGVVVVEMQRLRSMRDVFVRVVDVTVDRRGAAARHWNDR